MLTLKHGQFLLLVEWDLVVVISGQPWMLQGSRCVVSLRGRIGTKVQKEVFSERREIGWEFPLDGFRLYVLKLFVVVDLAWGVARMLTTGK